jgi:hypothetical protein
MAMQQRRLWSLNRLSVEIEMDRRTLAKKLEGVPADGEIKGHRAWHLSTALDAIESRQASSTRPVSRARTSVLQHFLDRIHDWRDLREGPPILCTIEDIAEMFDVSRETALGWLRAGMPYREPGCFETGEGFKLVLSWVIDWTFALNMLARVLGDHQGRRELGLR